MQNMLLLGLNSNETKIAANKAKIFRRSVFATRNIKKGEQLSKLNIRVIRPGYGISPKYYNQILNKKSPYSIKKEEPLKLNILKKLKITK